ncbi:hypothetical protein [Tropicimonas sp. IMCC6043]|uniref:hypothetical protein n=1 Tax=Tropicimonas sp. IMCC6043 TaxID=2510645 RepID=UPI00101B5B25|nr:hypothetical protein [Tropicimonas sp. IMCC6043]RYH06378.1 hypothetical protein EU800_24070 [Tropicimonas sp. IMCC6043]
MPRFIKLTFTGIQDKPVGSLVIGPEGMDVAEAIAALGLADPSEPDGPSELLIAEAGFSALFAKATSALEPLADAEASVLDLLIQDEAAQIRRVLAETDASAFLDRIAAALPEVAGAAETFSNWRFRTNL